MQTWCSTSPISVTSSTSACSSDVCEAFRVKCWVIGSMEFAGCVCILSRNATTAKRDRNESILLGDTTKKHWVFATEVCAWLSWDRDKAILGKMRKGWIDACVAHRSNTTAFFTPKYASNNDLNTPSHWCDRAEGAKRRKPVWFGGRYQWWVADDRPNHLNFGLNSLYLRRNIHWLYPKWDWQVP